jgi:hypothetical protein
MLVELAEPTAASRGATRQRTAQAVMPLPVTGIRKHVIVVTRTHRWTLSQTYRGYYFLECDAMYACRYQTIWRHILEESNLHIDGRENFESHRDESSTRTKASLHKIPIIISCSRPGLQNSTLPSSCLTIRLCIYSISFVLHVPPIPAVSRDHPSEVKLSPYKAVKVHKAPTFCLDNWLTDGGKVVSPTLRPPFTPFPKNIHGTHFC